jgi:hypothetical protein
VVSDVPQELNARFARHPAVDHCRRVRPPREEFTRLNGVGGRRAFVAALLIEDPDEKFSSRFVVVDHEDGGTNILRRSAHKRRRLPSPLE